jgi:hypothetical protein
MTDEEQHFGRIEWHDLDTVTAHIQRAFKAGERDYITSVLAAFRTAERLATIEECAKKAEQLMGNEKSNGIPNYVASAIRALTNQPHGKKEG